ncbi:MAG TPA: DUF2537 domain-containing protein [Pseudonocardia sp.]|jgi:hypothetical protein|nr:DUF2537 domain-containing protein [Pseudonocardia sp.]
MWSPRLRFARPRTGVGIDDRTPWATGLTVTALVALVIAVTNYALVSILRVRYGWAWIPANLLIAAGLAPTIGLMRAQPVWRWVAYGIIAGLSLAWVLALV